MKQVITALLIQVEITPYNEEGKVMPRPQPKQFSVYEVDIPGPVLDWVQSLLARG